MLFSYIYFLKCVQIYCNLKIGVFVYDRQSYVRLKSLLDTNVVARSDKGLREILYALKVEGGLSMQCIETV